MTLHDCINYKDGINSIAVLQRNGSVIAHSDPAVQFGQPTSSIAVIGALGTVYMRTVIEGSVFHTLIPLGERGEAIVDIAWNRNNFDSAVRNILKYSVLLFVLSVLTASLSCGYFLNKVIVQLEDIRQKLETLSITDALTGLANRRHFDEVLTKEYYRHVRSGHELSLILLDIDHFKAFNDNYGHVKGDECLQQVAKVIADYSNRAADLAARYGGEEFVCILPDTDLDGAVIIAEKIRLGIQALAIPHTGSNIAECVTASFGVVALECISDGSPIDIVTKADELLYKAKSLGRNRIECNRKLKQIGTNLLQLVWQDSFCSGNQLIDTQHQSLLHDSNKLLKAIIELRKKDEISSLATKLLSDVSQHFRDEEEILKTIAYPDLKQHALEHANLLNKAVKLAQEFESDTLQIGEVFEFLVYEMVQQHMLGADRKFFAYTGKS